MTRRIALPAIERDFALQPQSSLETAVLVLRTGQRPTRPCTIDDHLATMARQAEQDARDIAEILGGVINAVLDELELAAPIRAHANQLIASELVKASERWDAQEPTWPARP
jgi:hypothetical protein